VSEASIRDLLCLQLKAMAALQSQMAAALLGKGQDELRKHFTESAELLMKARAALARTQSPDPVEGDK
jgi:uncharacterized membrane-anchored protein YhcB (DUF1043 family)